MDLTTIVFAVINLILVVLLFLRIRSTSKGTSAPTGAIPKWAEEQLNELKSEASITSQKLSKAKESLSEEQIKNAQTISSLEAKLEAAHEKIKLQQDHFESQKEQAKADKETMTNEFKVLAEKILEEKSKQFKTTNSEELDKLLTPFKLKLTDFEKTVKENHKEELKNSSALMENIKALKTMNDQLTAEASGLAKALRGDTKKQGNWGEFVLERALEMSGLTKNQEFFVQNSETTADGRRLQPDVIIQLPEDKKIIVDSKVSLVAWEAYVNSEEAEGSKKHMKSLILSIQTHIKQLSEKDYPQLYDGATPEFVLLFIPIEAAFMEATKFDGTLYEFAFSKKIILVSTSTLLATLKTIAMAWRQEKQTRNVIEIADAGGKLYDKFVGLSEDLLKLGDQFNTAQKTYESSMNKMVDGRGNLISQVERLKELGSKTKKKLDSRIIERANLGEFSDKSSTKSIKE
ncbi:MAG: DNA recombination protein RmuC [Flavobacteriales bacterium]|jgi:DNA recombination protein RmuC|nr:DNA recombination protein RmuC [Flavobacteriales bacterium]MAZ97787.1 DNA recombination protein RmuC [Flavobacteriales bacterium]|tara:strand:+ start:3671 stop:5053 length:1383 start_codon:yes stop_codon:yes gene_type:complete